jgi:Na+/H+-dicarboxylate symporter
LVFVYLLCEYIYIYVYIYVSVTVKQTGKSLQFKPTNAAFYKHAKIHINPLVIYILGILGMCGIKKFKYKVKINILYVYIFQTRCILQLYIFFIFVPMCLCSFISVEN